MSQARIIALAFALSFTLTSWPASAGDNDNGFVRLTPDDLVWQVLEPGLSVAIVEGDPTKEGFYIIRARFAPGVFSAPHYHPNDRFITVIQGTWWTGIGPVFDKEGSVPLDPGSYMRHPAKAAHYDGSRDEEVIVEIKGMGPAPLVYVDEDGKPKEQAGVAAAAHARESQQTYVIECELPVIRHHADKGGFPANGISAVHAIIDPSTARE